ncbi:MAG: Integral membrane protein, partial [uncultured Nocardioides sp.]
APRCTVPQHQSPDSLGRGGQRGAVERPGAPAPRGGGGLLAPRRPRRRTAGTHHGRPAVLRLRPAGAAGVRGQHPHRRRVRRRRRGRPVAGRGRGTGRRVGCRRRRRRDRAAGPGHPRRHGRRPGRRVAHRRGRRGLRRAGLSTGHPRARAVRRLPGPHRGHRLGGRRRFGPGDAHRLPAARGGRRRWRSQRAGRGGARRRGRAGGARARLRLPAGRAAAAGRGGLDPRDVPGPARPDRPDRRLVRGAVPGRPDRPRRGHRLLAAHRHAVARGADSGPRQRRRGAHGDAHRRPVGALQRRDRRGVAGRPGAGAAAVPAQHRPRRAAHPALQRRDLAHPGARAAERRRPAAALAPPRPGPLAQPLLGGRGTTGARPPVAHHRGVHGRPAGTGRPGAHADPRLAAALRAGVVGPGLDGRHRRGPGRGPERGAATRGGARPGRHARRARRGPPGRGRRGRRRAAGRRGLGARWRGPAAGVAGRRPRQRGWAHRPGRGPCSGRRPARSRGRGQSRRGRRLRHRCLRRRGLGRAGRRRAHLPAAGPGAALGVAAGQGAGAQRRLHRRGVRRHRAGVAGGPRLRAALRAAGHRGHHDVGADRRLRLPVRALDGLRGVHPGADARGLRRARRHRPGGRRRHRPHRAAGDLGRADPVPRLRRPLDRAGGRGEGAGHDAGPRHRDRRRRGAGPPRAGQSGLV